MDAPATLSAASVRMAPRLQRDFFDRDARTVARELLGKLLVRRDGRNLLAGRVVECEAYLGAEDPAAHAFTGRTQRNAVLFGPPGHAYVYFIYGNHYCTNVSCMPAGNAGCVLLRALEPVAGWQGMAEARGVVLSVAPTKAQLRLIASGPGRLSEALGITRLRDNGKDLTSPRSDLWFAVDDYPQTQVRVTPRIGITKAADRPLRFIIAGNAFVSGTRML
jgi:DNA-3-methyladenine glycosylase